MSVGRILIFVIFVIVIYGGGNFYICRRVYQSLTFLFPKINKFIYIGIYIFFALSLILGRLMLPAGIKEALSLIGSYWMGVFLYLLLFLIITDVVILLGSLIKIFPKPMPQSLRFFAGLITVIFTVGIVSYGIYNANQIKNVSYTVQIKKTISDEMKIVLISDLHLGDVGSEKRVGRMVKMINDLKPDIVCMVGDIFTDDYYSIRNPDKVMNWLKSIEATYGVYASLGNHDGGRTLNKMMDFLKQSNITLLNDEHVMIDERLVLVGRLDASPIGGFGDMSRKSFADVMAQIDTNLPVVVMDHSPGTIGEYESETDLILAGHTHRGQIFPANLFTRAMFTIDYGHYQKDADSPHVIVTSGVSTWVMPMRVGTNNEIVNIVLR